MPHFGARVIGRAAYDALHAMETVNSGGNFGTRVTGIDAPPPAPVAVVQDSLSVRDTMTALKADRNVAKYAEMELARSEGARKSIIKILLAEGNRQGVDPALLTRLQNAPLGGEAQ